MGSSKFGFKMYSSFPLEIVFYATFLDQCGAGYGLLTATCLQTCDCDKQGHVLYTIFWCWIHSSLSRRTQVCEELRKKMVDVSCLQEIRWRGVGSRMSGVRGRRFMLW